MDNLLNFDTIKAKVLDDVAKLNKNIVEARKLIEKSDTEVSEPIERMFNLYEITIGGLEKLLSETLNLSEQYLINWQKVTHAINVEKQIKKGKISDN